MTSGNPDASYSVTGEDKELEILTAASFLTLKRGNKKTRKRSLSIGKRLDRYRHCLRRF